ncbi:hypothetical protein ACFL27_21245 [candidate division CSSED10-310 bacterium]|uniref:Uncharacterized protein n=1 Tax=candidate division CSSED10-310 bacterium TaxID=2855610 RepID=A0ABV6Z2Q6_UNCC1
MEEDSALAVVKIFTRDMAIVGKIMITEKEYHKGRLSDYMNRSDVLFIPVQEAHVISLETKTPIESRVFLLLNKNVIEWVIPIREPKTTDELGGMTELDIIETHE